MRGRSLQALIEGRDGPEAVFGGGLALYGTGKKIVGGVGVSGDTNRPDNIVYDIVSPGNSTSGYGHPKCANTGNQLTLPAVQQ